MLNNINNTEAGRNKWEGLQTDMFRVTFIFPQSIADEPLLTEHVMTVTGWTIHPHEIVEQDQGATRLRASNSIKTRQDLACTMTLNFNNENVLYVFEKLKEVHHLVGNPETFEKALASEYMFDMLVEYFLRNETPVYKRTAKNCIINGAFADGLFDVDIADSELKTLEFNVSAEYYTNEQITA